MRDARAIVDDSKDQPSISIPRPRKNLDSASGGASIAGIEKKIHDRVLKQARIAMDDRKVSCHIGMQIDVRFCKPMFDERYCPGDQDRWLNGFGSGAIAAGKPKQSANDSVNAINLFQNDANASRRPFVACEFGGQLLSPAGDDPKRRGNLVRNPNR